MRRTEFEEGTWIEAEDAAGPDGGLTRKGMALCRDAEGTSLRAIRAGIPDSFVSIPAKTRCAYVTRYTPKGPAVELLTVKGYASLDNGALIFTPSDVPKRCVYHPDHLDNPENYTNSGRLKASRKHLAHRS